MIWGLFIRSSPKAKNELENTDAKKIAFILKSNQDDVSAKFVPVRAFPAPIKSMKRMIESAKGTLEEVKRIEEAKKKNPDIEAQQQAHQTARTALLAIMKKAFTEILDGDDAFFGEDFTTIAGKYYGMFGTHRKEKIAEAKATASKSLLLQTKIDCAEKELQDLNTNMLSHMKDIMQEAAGLSDDYHNAKYEMEAAQLKLMKHHAKFADSLDNAVLKDAIKIRPLLEVLAATKMLGEDENAKLTKRGDEQSELHVMECKALEALLASGLLNEEEKKSLENFKADFKEEKTPFGFTYVDNRPIIVKIKDALTLVSDFSMLRQHLAHLKQEQNVIQASALLMAERIVEKRNHDGGAVEKDTATLKRELVLAAETIVELRRDLARETAAKETALGEARNVEARLEKAELELGKLNSLRELAANIGQEEPRRQSRAGNDRREEKAAPEEGNDWRVVNYNGRGGSRQSQRPQNRDNRDADQRKRGADEYSHFGLRDKDNQPFCQFQFTNAEGCNKKEKCRYANTHGMEDPHPGHESRNRKRPKKSAAPAAKDNDEKPRNARRDDRDRDDGNNDGGNDLNNID